ncbi:MAG TPA: hypothetical protein DCX77_04905 [Acidimicrobiaceae bacterium]|nr:hypothetical protein [Acidimicrobiaceae bacterium]
MSQVVRVLPDEPAVDREFDYLLTDEVVESSECTEVRIGTVVRVDLRGRRVRGWITALDVRPQQGLKLSAIKKISSYGPPAALVDLATWASRHWLGSRVHFLRTATHDRIVSSVPQEKSPQYTKFITNSLAEEAFNRGGAVVRTPPTSDDVAIAIAAATQGQALILVPTLARSQRLAVAMKRAGIEVALYPKDWRASAGGSVTIGTRSAAWAPIDPLDAVLVIDEHDEAYQQESAPTWHARDVVLERARRNGARWVITSPTPSLEALTCGAPLLTPDRRTERAGWPIIEIVDLRSEAPMAGSWCSEQLSRSLRNNRRAVCVVNRKGRARFAYCDQCGELARSEKTGKALGLDGDRLVHPADGDDRPAVCSACSSRKFRRVKLGVTGVREELEHIARRPVTEVDASTEVLPSDIDLYVGTEAIFHRIDSTDLVAFLDFDQELLAPRYRAAEEAMSLIAHAARLVGPRENGGRILIQTRVPQHPVLQAVINADPGSVARTELEMRKQLRQPPEAHWAVISGASAAEFVERLGNPDGLEVMNANNKRWRVRSDDRELMLEILSNVERPAGRLRIEINPLRA